MGRRKIDSQKELISTIKKLGQCSYNEIAKKADISHSTVSTFLNTSLKNGLISASVEEEYNGRRSIIYTLTDNGEKYLTLQKELEHLVNSVKPEGST